MEIISQSPGQTQAIARLLGQTILESKSQDGALVLALQGDLGGGKTTFIQGLAQGLGIKQNLTSPTFVVMKSYNIPHPNLPPLKGGRRQGFVAFYHLDCYRLCNAKDLEILGIKEILADPKNIVAIEWAERVVKILPKNSIKVSFKFVDENQRGLEITAKQSSRTNIANKEVWEEIIDFTKIKDGGVDIADILK